VTCCPNADVHRHAVVAFLLFSTEEYAGGGTDGSVHCCGSERLVSSSVCSII
jgi:hypothetical protein